MRIKAPWPKDRAAVQAQEERLREMINALPDEQRRALYEEVGKRLKDPDSYAVLNFFLLAGLHHFYLGKWRRGWVNLTVFCVGLTIVAIDLSGAYIPLIDQSGLILALTNWRLGLGLLLGIFIVELPALFDSQTIVQDHNNRMMEEIYRELAHD